MIPENCSHMWLKRWMLAKGCSTNQSTRLFQRAHFVAPEVLLPAILNCLKSVEQPIFLFLDDLHYLTEPAAQNVLATLIGRLPENVHAIAASRETPFLRLACMRARGTIT